MDWPQSLCSRSGLGLEMALGALERIPFRVCPEAVLGAVEGYWMEGMPCKGGSCWLWTPLLELRVAHTLPRDLDPDSPELSAGLARAEVLGGLLVWSPHLSEEQMGLHVSPGACRPLSLAVLSGVLVL